MCCLGVPFRIFALLFVFLSVGSGYAALTKFALSYLGGCCSLMVPGYGCAQMWWGTWLGWRLAYLSVWLITLRIHTVPSEIISLSSLVRRTFYDVAHTQGKPLP